VNGTNGAVLYVGTTLPQSGAGANGDFYINTATGDIYSKSSLIWNFVENINHIKTESANAGSHLATGMLTFSGGKATIDQSSMTGVKVDVSASSAQNGFVAAVTSINYGTAQPPETGALQINGAQFYDVKLTSASPFASDAMATISLSNPAFTSQDNVLSYWNGDQWVTVACTFSPPNTVTAVIPANALTGTPIAVGTAPQSNGNASFPFSDAVIVLVAIIAVVIVVALIAINKSRKTKPQQPTL
jgi:hypothetical protein